MEQTKKTPRFGLGEKVRTKDGKECVVTVSRYVFIPNWDGFQYELKDEDDKTYHALETELTPVIKTKKR